MNAKNIKQTKTTKTTKTETKPEKPEKPQIKSDEKLPRPPNKTLAAPRISVELGKPRNRTQVVPVKGSKNLGRRVGLESPIKGQRPRPIPRSRVEYTGINPHRQKILGKAAPALQGRTATTARVGSSPVDIQARLKRKSPWFSSIMSPITSAGVKIPDPVGTNTSTYQHVENVSVSVNANGISGLRIICPYINNYHYGGADDDGSNYQTTNQESIITNLKWGVSPTPGSGAYPFALIPPIMKANAQSHRIVSCSVIAQPEVSTLNDAGEMCAFVTPFDCNDAEVAYATLQSQWDSSLMPVNQHKPQISRWYPLSSDFQMFNTVETVEDGNHEPSTISYQDFMDPDYRTTDETALRGVTPFEIGIVCTGMSPSTGVVRFQIVVNYEFIPKTQTTMLDTNPSPIDPTEEQLVNSWVSDCPITGPISLKQAAATPAASTVSERSEPSGFGMIFNVVEEMMPLIKTGLSLL